MGKMCVVVICILTLRKMKFVYKVVSWNVRVEMSYVERMHARNFYQK